MKNVTLRLYQQLSILFLIPGINQAQSPSPDFYRLDTLINGKVGIKNTIYIPSISVAIVQKGKIVFEKSYGWSDRDGNIPATIHTPYYLASLTKAFTATALSRLSEQQRINWDRPVNDYLHNARIKGYRWDASESTILRMATHTAGLSTYGQWCSTIGNCLSFDTIINRYGTIVQQPGKGFDYSNLGYGVLSQLIADVSGSSYARYLQEQVFVPLGMKDSYVKDGSGLFRSLETRSAAGYKYWTPPYDKVDEVIPYALGASCVYSSVHDLALFTLAQLGHKVNGNTFISTEARSFMQTPKVATGGAGKTYGIGWWLDSSYHGFKGVLAQGGNIGAQAAIQLLPSEDIGVIVLSNSGALNTQPIITEALSSVLPAFRQSLAAEVPPVQNTAPAPPVTPSDSLFGNWKGMVKTWKKELPLSISIDPSGSMVFQLGQAADTTISKPRLRNNRVSFTASGDLDIKEDTGDNPYQLNFYLTQSGSSLFGLLTTGSVGGSAVASLSVWVQLEKSKGSFTAKDR